MSTDASNVPSVELQRALQKGLGCCNSVAQQVEYFEQLAQACPELDPLVSELRLKLEHLSKLCRTGLGMTGATQS